MTATKRSIPDWANIARCAELRYKAFTQEAETTGEKTSNGYVLWNPLYERSVDELNTCLHARLLEANKDKIRQDALKKP